MVIKKHSTGNRYALAAGVWVRDFTGPAGHLDINRLASAADYPLFLQNEVRNDRLQNLPVEFGEAVAAVIVSDGFGFKEKHKLLTELPKSVLVLATNRALAKWEADRKIDFFVVNNPYPECMSQLPSHRYYPKCLASTRTHPEFLESYKKRGGEITHYAPPPEPGYTSAIPATRLDDYRNPVCAAVSAAHRMGVKRLLLLCCDDSFEGERPAAVRLANGLWTYPQHLTAHGIIGTMLGWYKKTPGTKVSDHSSGPVYDDAPYIPEDEVGKFFEQR